MDRALVLEVKAEPEHSPSGVRSSNARIRRPGNSGTIIGSPAFFAWFILLMLNLMAAQLIGQQPIPRHKPDGNPQHDNQPEWCQNVNMGGREHNCACKAMPDPSGRDREHCDDKLPGETEGGGESSKCAVYCRKSACRCVDPCTT